MRGEDDQVQVQRRLDELAARASRTGRPCFTSFLSPAEMEWAYASSRRQRVNVTFEGGYEDAERRMACFWDEEEPDTFPFTAIELTWPHQSAPGHRDVLGSVMGLGLKRSLIGDIVLEAERGYLFAEEQMTEHITQTLTSAGRIRLQLRLTDGLPPITPPKGTQLHETVASLRLDAVLASGFHLSRTDAAELITSGLVKLRHLPCDRTDARVDEGDAISARGYGRLVVEQVGSPTKKGRLPLTLMRYGANR